MDSKVMSILEDKKVKVNSIQTHYEYVIQHLEYIMSILDNIYEEIEEKGRNKTLVDITSKMFVDLGGVIDAYMIYSHKVKASSTAHESYKATLASIKAWAIEVQDKLIEEKYVSDETGVLLFGQASRLISKTAEEFEELGIECN